MIAFFLSSEVFNMFVLSKVVPPSLDTFPSWISSWDGHLFIFINMRLSSPLLVNFFNLLTNVGSTFFALLLCVSLYLLGFRREAILVFISIALSSFLIIPFKLFILRPRPYLSLPGAIISEEGSGSSFPSGHSTRAFAMASALSGKGKRLTIFMYVLAFLVAFSRIYIGAHYPFDSIFGSLLGFLSGKLVLRYEDRFLLFFKDFH